MIDIAGIIVVVVVGLILAAHQLYRIEQRINTLIKPRAPSPELVWARSVYWMLKGAYPMNQLTDCPRSEIDRCLIIFSIDLRDDLIETAPKSVRIDND